MEHPYTCAFAHTHTLTSYNSVVRKNETCFAQSWEKKDSIPTQSACDNRENWRHFQNAGLFVEKRGKTAKNVYVGMCLYVYVCITTNLFFLFQTETEHINLKVLGQDNAVVQFKIKKHTPLRKLMNAYCDRAVSDIHNS